MTLSISKDTRLCMSLSGRPGNFGTRFQNYLYQELQLDYLYKAFTTTDLPAAIGGIRALGVRGCAVSMPFKEACIAHLDALHESAATLQSVNTIVADDGHLTGYNTDYSAVVHLLALHGVPKSSQYALRGSGGMAKAVACALRDSGFGNGLIVARNEAAGRALAEQCGVSWSRHWATSRQTCWSTSRRWVCVARRPSNWPSTSAPLPLPSGYSMWSPCRWRPH